METEYLTYFKQIAETENMSQASRILHISQPSLSRILKKIEKRYGCLLFIRKGKTLKLNHAGRILFDYSTQILSLLNQSLSDIQTLSETTQNITLNMLYSNKLLPTMLAAFNATNPRILINLTRFENDNLSNFNSDIIIHASDKLAASRPSQKLADEECLIGVSTKHPFASINEIPLELLSNEKFVILNKNNILGGTTLSFFQHVGISPQIVMECDNQSSIDSFVSLNLGVAVFPSLTWNPTHDNIVYKKIKGYHIIRTLYITSTSLHNSIATNIFKKFVINYMQKNFQITGSDILLNKTPHICQKR
jgi:LysR family transcriptional regulator, transcription activator of glutamate synthase operon